MSENSKKEIRKLLLFYDILIYSSVVTLMLVVLPSGIEGLSYNATIIHALTCGACVFLCRFLMDIYKQIWRYGGMSQFLRLIVADVLGGCVYYILDRALMAEHIMFVRAISIVSLNLLGAIVERILYYNLYQYASTNRSGSSVARNILKWFGAVTVIDDNSRTVAAAHKINVAIVGAGRVGFGLAQELLANPNASYNPVCFVDIDRKKIGRSILNMPVLGKKDIESGELNKLKVQEIIFALPLMESSKRKELYDYYSKAGYKVKIYDYPIMQTAGTSRRQLREFDIEELLFRKPVNILDDRTIEYYCAKVVLITGGGGSIGSELARQVATMSPKKLIILDIYENGAYDIQQELKIAYGSKLDIAVEIASVCDREELEKIWLEYMPDIVLHAAAHKHVPLMERNVGEAIKNNIFGTKNVLDMVEKYETGRFIMISTDKAVNPTNVMGATKRFCEMMVLANRNKTKTVYSATRFGNVLGSNGSVIPLFKKQIANGGPITLTDKRIIRYFMTIPEASQLVLKSGMLAKNGELFVLDMGKPVKIVELAESMIMLSGLRPYIDINIIETGLRPGEKLYEELLIKGESVTKTEDSKIFIEEDESLNVSMIDEYLGILRDVTENKDDETIKDTLKKLVPTFKTPQLINEKVVL